MTRGRGYALVLMLGALQVLGCGGRTLDGTGGGASESDVCHAEVGWQRDWSDPPHGLLADVVGTADGFVAAGAHVIGNPPRSGTRDGTLVVAVGRDGSDRWGRTLPQDFGAIARFGDGVVIGGAGQASQPGNSPDVVLTHLRSDGEPEWTVRWGTEDEDSVQSLVVSDDEIFVLGTSMPAVSEFDLLIGRVSARGELAWQQLLGEPRLSLYEFRDERPIGGYVNDRGHFVVAAQRWLNGGGGPPWIFALDRDGNMVWEHRSRVEYERASAWVFIPTADGGSMLVGQLESDWAGGPARVIRLDDVGTVMWTASLDDGSDNQQLTHDAVELADGGFAIVGYSANTREARLWRLDRKGRLEVERDYTGEGQLYWVDAAGRDRLLLAAANREPATDSSGWWLTSTTTSGDSIWEIRSDFPATTSFLATARSDPGRILVLGSGWTDESRLSRMLLASEICE